MIPITLSIITDEDPSELINKSLERVQFQEVLVISQGFQFKSSLAKVKAFRTFWKGNADPDRQLVNSLATQPWILFLDIDEEISPELAKILPRLLNLPYHVYWIPFLNLVEGRDIRSILGEDYHPRLFRKNSIRWPSQLHTFPEIASNAFQFWLKPKYHIIHSRTWETIKKSHIKRKKIRTERDYQVEKAFLQRLRNFLQIEDDLSWFE
ncbi:MAG TPA: hypothetical protein EYP29_04980 [Thermoplasmata archaeon]|nr:hypothetical protein [Thermoplasmata archaeon]